VFKVIDDGMRLALCGVVHKQTGMSCLGPSVDECSAPPKRLCDTPVLIYLSVCVFVSTQKVTGRYDGNFPTHCHLVFLSIPFVAFL